MNLVRLGHLYTPPGHGTNQGRGAGRCETALVCGVFAPDNGGVFAAENAGHETVNLRVFDFEATDRRELNIRVEPPVYDGISFHLSADCPWKL